MIIRLGLMDRDEHYISRLSDYLATRSDDVTALELYLFSCMEDYYKFSANQGRIDILLTSVDTLSDPQELSSDIVLAYFSEDKTMVEYKGKSTICKYQKGSDIYRAIQGLSAGISGIGKHSFGQKGRILLFMGSAGGVGCTTAAIGCAARLRRIGKRVAYVSYQQNAQPSLFFSNMGESMSEVHYAYQEWLRQQQNDDEDKMYQLQLRLKGLISTDADTGVDCFDAYRLPIDAFDLTPSELKDQLTALSNQYDDCVVDMDCEIDEHLLEAIRLSSWIVLVSNGTNKANLCLNALVKSLKALNDGGDSLLRREIAVLYTCFGSKARESADVKKIARVLEIIPNYKDASEKDIIRELSKSGAYKSIEEAVR